MNVVGCKTNKHKAKKTQVLQSEKNDHMMNVMYTNEDVLVMPTNLTHQLGKCTQLKQTSSRNEL